MTQTLLPGEPRTIEMLKTIKVRVDLFNENGKWKYGFEVDVDFTWDHGDLLRQIDERQQEVVKNTVIGGHYYVVLDDAPQQAITPDAHFFMKRLYTPQAVTKYCSEGISYEEPQRP